MLVGVIADTHGLLRPEAEQRLKGVDHILHAGDVGSPEIIPRLRRIAPTTAIRGNVDTQPWAMEYPTREVVTLAGRSIYLLHDVAELDLDPAAAGFAMVVFGHSHQPSVEIKDGVVFLNPGSAGPRRFKLPVTLATVGLTAEAIRPELHQLVS